MSGTSYELSGTSFPAGPFLFVPATERRLAKIVELDDVDTVVLDLEDAIPPLQKTDARTLVAEALHGLSPQLRVVVRINAEPELMALDLAAVVTDRIDFVMLPKTESPEQLRELDHRIAERESLHARTDPIQVIALIESARGVVGAEEIAAKGSPRLVAMAMGPADLAADLDLPPESDADDLAYARSRVVVAARAAGLAAAIDGPYPKIDDVEGLVADSVRSRRLGFRGRLVLHPAHVRPVARVYRDHDGRHLDYARRLVAQFEEEVGVGNGVIVIDGEVVDAPVYARYKQLLVEAGG